MIKKTLYFGNPAYLKKENNQLLIQYKGEVDTDKSVPIEDIGLIVLDHYQLTLSHALISALLENNVAILSCDNRHLPEGLMLPMQSHHAFTEKVRLQVNASEPLRKNLWQQTVVAKIANQGALLQKLGLKSENMLHWSKQVKSGDRENLEARAAAFYWDTIFEGIPDFRRHRYGDPPNNLLNYGYAVLRAAIARALVSSGMMTYFGIHHRNKYNPYCLADDVMEPYRPYVDEIVIDIIRDEENLEELTPSLKKRLLVLPAIDVKIDQNKSPLMMAAGRTSASMMNCFEKTERKLLYPVFE